MSFCKHCGHSSTKSFLEDEWGFIVCPVCGSDHVIDSEEDEEEEESPIKNKPAYKKVGNLIIPI